MTTPTTIPVNGDGTYDDPTWGESGGPFSVPASEAAGYGAVVLPSNDINYEWQHQSRWIRALRDRMVRSDDGLFTNCIVKAGAWNTGGGTLDGTLGVTRVVVDASSDGGVMVELSIPAGSPHTFTASRDTYVNINESGALEYQAVPNGDPAPVPSAGYVAFWLVVTDGTELTSATALVPTIPTFGAIRIAGIAQFGSSMTVASSVSVGTSLTVNGNTTLGDNPSDTVDVSGPLVVSGLVEVGGTLEVGGSATFLGNVFLGDAVGDAVTVAGPLTMSAGALTCNGPIICNSNVTLGDAAGDLITINGTTTIAANVDFGANTITGAGGTITTSTVNASAVVPTEVRFNTTSPSVTTGRTAYNGRRLSVGAGGVATVVQSVARAYVVSATTTSSIADLAGASVTLDVGDDEWVWVTVSCRQLVSASGQAPTIRVSATNGTDSVTILNLGDDDQATVQYPDTTSTNQIRNSGFTVRWKPTNDVVTPASTTWSIYVRHGVTGGATLTTSNVVLEVGYD